MPSGLKLWGIMTATAIILPSGSPTLLKAAARLAKVVFHDRIQICDGTDDYEEYVAAYNALPATGGEIKALEGTYNWGTGTLAVTKDFVFLNFHDALIEYSGTAQWLTVIGTPAGFSLRGFRLDVGKLTAVGAAIASATATGILLRHVSYGAEIWANIHNFEAGTGVYLDSNLANTQYCGLINFHKLMLQNMKFGVVLAGNYQIHALTFEQFNFSPSADDSRGILDSNTYATPSRWMRFGTVYIENPAAYTGCVGLYLGGDENEIGTLIQDGAFDNSVICPYEVTIHNCEATALSTLDIPSGSHINYEGAHGARTQVNLLMNGDFELGNPPIGWTGLRATIIQEGGAGLYKIESKSLKITANDGVGVGWGYAWQRVSDFARYQGRRVTLGAWVRAASGNDQSQVLAIEDGVDITQGSVIPKDDAWHWFTVTRLIAAGATHLEAQFVVKYTAADVDDILYVDGAILVEGDTCPAFSPPPARHMTEKEFTVNAFQYPAPGTDWTPQVEGAWLAASLGAKKCWLPLNFLKEGDYIVSYKLVGDATEAAALTLDCKLVRVNKADPLTTTNVAGGAIVQVDAFGNFDSEATLTALEEVVTDKQYVLELLGTTGAGDSITVMGAEVKIYRLG